MVGDRYHVVARVFANLEEAGDREVAVAHLAVVVERKLDSRLGFLQARGAHHRFRTTGLIPSLFL